MTFKSPMKKEIRFTIKALRAGALFGITDLAIPLQINLKKVEEFQRSCTIVMSDATKRTLYNTTGINWTLRIIVSAKFTYHDKPTTGNASKVSITPIPKDKEDEKENDNSKYILIYF